MLKWIGTTASIAGSFLVAFGIILAGYGAFLVGSLSWAIIAVRTKDSALLTLNGVFLCANIIGLVRAL